MLTLGHNLLAFTFGLADHAVTLAFRLNYSRLLGGLGLNNDLRDTRGEQGGVRACTC